MGAPHPDVDTTSLWDQAQRIFRASNPKADSQFLEHDETPKGITRYLRHKKGQAAWKSNRCGPLLERLDVIAEIGDIAMRAAPESVGLVWTGFRFVFKMILLDSQTCGALVDAVDLFSEVVLVCQLYGRRYLSSGHRNPGIKARVLERIPGALSTVLEFSYLVQKFFKHSHARALRNLFTGTDFKLQNTIQKCKTEYEALRNLDDTGFKEEIRRGNAQFQNVMKIVFTSLNSKLDHLNGELMKLKEQGDETKVLEEFERNKDWFQSAIVGANIPRDRHADNIRKRYPDSCQWILGEKVTEFQAWMCDPKRLSINRQGKLANPRMLWLHGNGGVGKSILVSTIISELQDKRGHLMVYFFCKLGDRGSESGSLIMLHLCAQLFRKGSQRDLDVQRELNEVVNAMREDLSDSCKENPSNIPISTTRPLFQRLANTLGKDITIAVDGLDECVDPVDSGFLDALKVLARSNSAIRVLVSSRNPPDSKDTPSVFIDKSKTENDIRLYATAKIKVPWAVDEIVKRSEGRFRFATMAIEQLQSSAAGVRSLSRRMKDLPNTMNDLYLQIFRLLKNDSQEVLVTVLRWLICRGDRIELQPIADELAQKYSPEEPSNNSASELPSLQDVAKRLTEISRDFLKVTDKAVQLDHNSVRDFIECTSRESRAAGTTCSECGTRNLAGLLAQAAGKEGKLIMAEYMLQTVNSVRFQEEFILFDRRKSSSKAKGSRKSPSSKGQPMRNEISGWYQRLRDAETAWTTDERKAEGRWEALYKSAERFLSQDSQVYQDWLVRKNTIQEQVGEHDHPIYTAARYGLEGLIQRYLDQGCDVNVKNRHQNTPLHRVCMNTDAYCKSAGLTVLLENGARVNEQNDEDVTPLLAAFQFEASKGVTRPIKNLLDAGADPTITDKWQRSCLHYAARSHNIDACRKLLPASNQQESRQRVNLKDHHSETPLHWACKANAPRELIELLLRRGADLHVRDNEQQTALYEACRVGNEPVARLFLEKGADIRDKDFKSDTALHEAVYSGNLSLVEFLVRQGAQIEVRNGSQQTPLALAASRNAWDILFFLVDYHSRSRGNMDILLQQDSHGDTPLSLAVTGGNLVAVQKLLDTTSVGDATARKMCRIIDFDKNQPLHKAASHGSAEICRLLIDRGAPTDRGGKTNEYGSTPLDAAFKGWQEWNGDDASRLLEFEETVKVLLFKSTKIAARSRKLICATWRGSASVCQHLSSIMTSTDEHGWFRAVTAAAYGNKEIAHTMPMCSDGWKKYIDELLSGKVRKESHGHMPSTWSATNKHEAVTLSEESLVASFTSSEDSWKEASVLANHPVPAGVRRFYYEVKIDKIDDEGGDSAKLGVGFCTELAYYTSIPGSRSSKAPSWGYHGDTGKLFTRFDYGHSYKTKPGDKSTRTFGNGDIIGCGIDFTNGLSHAKIFYTLNGKDLGVAFEGVSGRLFPAVGSKLAGWKMKANFGKEPFKWKDAKME